MPEPFTVRTLMGAGSFETSVICLRSAVACSLQPFNLVIHDDGTLTPEHQRRLRAEVNPNVSFVQRKDADDLILPQLAKYPACLAYRRSAPLALKLFDTTLLSDGPLVFIDSDVYFRRAVNGFFDPHRADGPVFMDNRTHSYAIRPWRAWPVGAIRLAGRINTGVIVGWAAGFDLDFLEWLLSRMACDICYHTRRYWVEQTCWAALASRTQSSLFDPQKLAMASATMNWVSPHTAAIHFVSTFRGFLRDYQIVAPATEKTPVEVNSTRARQVNAFDLSWSDILRRF
jgi:hypothetical protein